MQFLDSSETFLITQTEKHYAFWATMPNFVRQKPPAATPSRHPPNSTTSRLSHTSTSLSKLKREKSRTRKNKKKQNFKAVSLKVKEHCETL